MAIPVPLMGISLVHLWNQPWLNGIYHTPVVLVAAHAGRLLPFAVFAAASQLRYLDPLLAEAAALPPVSAWRRLWWVSAPLAAPAATVAWLVVFLFSLGELGVSLLVAPPGYATLSMRIYNLLHYGATDLVAGMSLIVLTIGLGAAILVLMARRWLWLRMI
jgi:iron(III) transport system permease protein